MYKPELTLFIGLRTPARPASIVPAFQPGRSTASDSRDVIVNVAISAIHLVALMLHDLSLNRRKR